MARLTFRPHQRGRRLVLRDAHLNPTLVRCTKIQPHIITTADEMTRTSSHFKARKPKPNMSTFCSKASMVGCKYYLRQLTNCGTVVICCALK